MLTLIHGDDTAMSRNNYTAIRVITQEKKIIDGSSVTLTDLMQIFSGNGLFGDQETIFIEELLSKRKSTKDIEEIVNFLNQQKDATVIIWESKTLTPKQIGLFQQVTVKEFKIPTIVFTFLDSLRPKNSQQMIHLFHQILEHEDSVYVLVMLIRHIRILLALSEDSETTISEVTRMAPWQKNKLAQQANLYTTKQLLSLHKQLFDLELGQKTGTLATSLSNAIDFFLLSI